jgi:hypothetical protein
MVFSLSVFVLALIVIFAVGLVLTFVGTHLAPALKAPPLVAIGAFLGQWAWPIALAVGIWYYFSHVGLI